MIEMPNKQDVDETFDTIDRAYEFNDMERRIFRELLTGINLVADGSSMEFEMPIQKRSGLTLIRLRIKVERIKFA